MKDLGRTDFGVSVEAELKVDEFDPDGDASSIELFEFGGESVDLGNRRQFFSHPRIVGQPTAARNSL